MALDGRVLGTMISEAMAKADAQMAPEVTLADGTKVQIDTNTPQKQAERAATSRELGLAIIKYLKDNTEVIIPSHPSNVAVTAIGGGPPHAHGSNQTPIPHIIGHIK